MKKFFLAVSVTFLIVLGMLVTTASAQRYTSLPVSITEGTYYKETFTIEEFEVYTYPHESLLYRNTAEIWIGGTFNAGYNIDLYFTCYDSAGNNLTTILDTIDKYEMQNTEEGYAYFELTVPDVTASIEVRAAKPGSWDNSYYYCKYKNVYAPDGRVLGIHDMLLPVYQKCGWYDTIWMYSLDGREIEVPECFASDYQKVGWYLWEDFYYNTLINEYNELVKSGNYAEAFDTIDEAIIVFEGTSYANGLYVLKTQLMDLWRKKVNGPLAICSSDVYDEELEICFRNVSYKDIKAFKVQFDCYDVFGKYIYDYYEYYYIEDADLASGGYDDYYWDGIPYNTDYVRNIRVTQVVYEDGTSWYR